MASIQRTQLSLRDFGVVERLLRQNLGNPAFSRLVQQKLATADIYVQGELEFGTSQPSGRRVDFVIDGQLCDSLILVSEERPSPSRLTLPITTMRGLALLGLKAGDTIEIEWSDGRTESASGSTKVNPSSTDRRTNRRNTPPATSGAPRRFNGGSGQLTSENVAHQRSKPFWSDLTMTIPDLSQLECGNVILPASRGAFADKDRFGVNLDAGKEALNYLQANKKGAGLIRPWRSQKAHAEEHAGKSNGNRGHRWKTSASTCLCAST